MRKILIRSLTICGLLVLAAGAFSHRIARSLGDKIPLETERGYHAELRDPEVAPRHGLMPSDGKMSVMRTASLPGVLEG